MKNIKSMEGVYDWLLSGIRVVNMDGDVNAIW